MKKPTVLYHGSSVSGLRLLEPQAHKIRHPAEGPVVFAAVALPLATLFIVPTDDSWTVSGTFGRVYHIVISDRERFTRNDHGGSVYVVPGESFSCDPEKGLGELEWVSAVPVKPIDEFIFRSALEAMLENRVQVFWVTPVTFGTIREAEDHGLSILQSLPSENEIRGLNRVPLVKP